MASEDVGVACQRFIGLVDGVAVEDRGATGDAGLSVDHGVAADHSRISIDVADDGEVAEEHKDVAGDVTLDLDGAEEAGCVADLLAGRNKDVLPEVGAVRVGPGLRTTGQSSRGERRGQQKR